MVNVLLCTKDTGRHGKLISVSQSVKYRGSRIWRIVMWHFIEQLALNIVSGLVSNVLDSLKNGLNVVFAMFSVEFLLR